MYKRQADGVPARRAELAAFLVEYDADVILLSETHLAPNRRLSLSAYACYRKDRHGPNRHRAFGGVAILVHRRNSHRELPAPATTLIEACAVALDVAGLEVRFVSAYHQMCIRDRHRASSSIERKQNTNPNLKILSRPASWLKVRCSPSGPVREQSCAGYCSYFVRGVLVPKCGECQ